MESVSGNVYNSAAPSFGNIVKDYIKKMRFSDFWKEVREGQKEFGEDISRIISCLLLTVAYFIGIGITLFFLKISKKEFLEIKIEKERRSYWSDLNLTKKPLNDYYRQF